MAALSEKIIWPIVGIFIFGVIAGFYIDDRRRLAAESSAETSNQQASTQQESTTTKPAKATSSSATKQTASKPSSSSSTQEHDATSMSIDEYLAQSAHERSELKGLIIKVVPSLAEYRLSLSFKSKSPV